MIPPANLRRLLHWTWMHITTPSTPPAGFCRLYFKSDDILYQKTSAGVESAVSSGGAYDPTIDLELTTAGKGLILKNSDGSRYKITVDTDLALGTLIITKL